MYLYLQRKKFQDLAAYKPKLTVAYLYKWGIWILKLVLYFDKN